MGTVRIPPQQPAAIGIPLAIRSWTGALSTVGDAGSYSQAGLEAGPVTPTSPSTLALEASGTPSIIFPGGVLAQVVNAGFGGAGSDTAGIAYRLGALGDWYGRERFSLMTGYAGIEEGMASARHPTAVPLDDGSIVLGVTSDLGYEVFRRGVNGLWSGSTVLASPPPSGPAVGTVIRAPDGSLHAYAITTIPNLPAPRLSVWRSTDGGATWTSQRDDTIGEQLPTTVKRLHGATDATGGVGLWMVFGDFDDPSVAQFYSSDGGFTFRGTIQPTNPATVLALTVADSAIYAMTAEPDGTGTGYAFYVRRVGSAGDDLFATAPLWTPTGLPADLSATCTAIIVSPDPGVLLVSMRGDNETGDILGSWRSEDGGATWVQRDFGPFYAPTDATAAWRGEIETCGVVCRQRLHMFAVANGRADLIETIYGGNTTHTAGYSSRFMSYAFYPTNPAEDWGWTITEVGTPAHTLTAKLGELIECGAGESSSTRYELDAAGPAVALMCVRPEPGGNTVLVDVAGDTDTVRIGLSTDGGTPDILRIRVYDAGDTPPAWQTLGNAGDFVELLVGIKGDRAWVGHRIRNVNLQPGDFAQREWNTTQGAGAITLTSNTNTFSGVDFIVPILGNKGRMLFAWVNPIDDPLFQTGWTFPDFLIPIPITPRPTYIVAGMSLRHVAGVPRVDGVAHRIGYTSPYRAENVLPDYSPSPSAVWRSADANTQVLSWTVEGGYGIAHQAIYFAGLKNIETMTLTTGVLSNSLTISTTRAFSYNGVGRLIYGAFTGVSPAAIRFVRAGELAGMQFKLQSGIIRTITGNTEGWLTRGTTGAGEAYRASIYLDGDVDVVGTTRTGSFLSSSAWVFLRDAGDTYTLTIPGTPTNPNATREIGVVAPFALTVLGMAPDLDDQWTRAAGTQIQTAQDGKRWSVRRAPDRRRVRIAYVASPHEVRQEESALGGDYVVVSSTSIFPAGEWTGIPYTLDGVVAAAAGRPVLWVPRVPPGMTDSGVVQTYVSTPIGQHVIYGRITSDASYEAVPLVGARGVSQAFRVPAITIEEET